MRRRALALFLKRGLDVVGSLIALVVLALPMAAMGVAILCESGGPVLFVQERVGKDGHLFRIYKFRTMRREVSGERAFYPLGDADPRLTKVGVFLRRWSLDELPQLINVLLGDMSLVGPRPTLKYQVDRYDEVQRERLLVKPGITGWAQVNGRNTLTWRERIELDIWYARNWSIPLDLVIIGRTLPVIVSGTGLYCPDVLDDLASPLD